MACALPGTRHVVNEGTEHDYRGYQGPGSFKGQGTIGATLQHGQAGRNLLCKQAGPDRDGRAHQRRKLPPTLPKASQLEPSRRP